VETAHNALGKSIFLIVFQKTSRVGTVVALSKGALGRREVGQTQAEWECKPRRLRMRSNHAMTGNPQRELGTQSQSLLRDESLLENDLENRIGNLDRLVDSTYAALGQESFSGKPHALDFVNDLRVKVKANRNMFRVAKLLSEPARKSMLLRIRDCLNDLEEVVASQLGVKMS